MGMLYSIPHKVYPSYTATDDFVDILVEPASTIYNDIISNGATIIDGTNSDNIYYNGKVVASIEGCMYGIYTVSGGYYIGFCYPANCLVYEATIRNFSPNKFLHNPHVASNGYFISNYKQALTLPQGIEPYSTRTELDAALSEYYTSVYPITYSYTNSTVSGPSIMAVGYTVTVSAVPNAGYGITDASSQILVTNNDVAVPYTWDATNNRITFTMPDPS